ncbi:MAG TPA: copper chaperone PCu(A)C [Casimicrobiaceae bacterium]
MRIPAAWPRRWLAAALLLFASAAGGLGVTTVSDPWARPAPVHGNTSVFVVLGTSEDAKIVGARSAFGQVRLTRGKAIVDTVDVTAGKPLAMSPGGVHLTLRNVNRRLELGDHVTLTLVLRDAQGRTQEVPVDAEVRHRSPLDDERRAHERGHKH